MYYIIIIQNYDYVESTPAHVDIGYYELHLKTAPLFGEAPAESRSQCGGSWECGGFNGDRYFQRLGTVAGLARKAGQPTALLSPVHWLKLKYKRATCVCCPRCRVYSRTALDGQRTAVGGSLRGYLLEGSSRSTLFATLRSVYVRQHLTWRVRSKMQ